MSTPAGWYPDPTGRHQNRWFDGDDWTDSIADGGTVGNDPVRGGAAAAGAGATQAIPTPSPQTPAPGQSTPPTEPTPAATVPPTQAAPAAGAVGEPPPGAPLSTYTGPPGSEPGGKKSKTGLIIGLLVVLAVIVVGVVLLTQGGDDGGGETASDSSEDLSDEPEEEDPELADLFDPMGEGVADEEDEPGEEPDTTEPEDEPDTTEPEDEPDDTTVDGEYPQEAIDGFNAACTGSGGDPALCQCIIEVLERDVAYERLLELNEQLEQNPDDIPQELQDAVAECQAG